MTRKEQVEKYIDEQTALSISDNSFNFENCNAHIISLELGIDRTNVSRILNQLFVENRLIKIDGRPTLYISKSIIYESIQVKQLPSIIKKGESIKDYIEDYNLAQKPNSKIEIIGIQKNESLHFVYNKLIPYFINPPYSAPLIFILNGENGTGRKHFVEQLFLYAKSKKKFKKEQTIFYSSSLLEQFNTTELDPKNNPVIIIQIDKQINYEYSDIFKIIELYKNSMAEMPMIFIIQNTDINQIKIPYFVNSVFNFPKLESRKINEIAQLVIYFILLQSKNTQREIYVPKNIIILLSNKKYSKMNCTELYYNIYTFISSCLYHSSENKNTPIILDETYLSTSFKNISCDLLNNYDEFINTLPETLILKPSMYIHDIKIFTNIKKDTIFLSTPEEFTQNIETIISSLPTSFNDINNDTSDFSKIITEKLESTILSKDPQIIIFLTKVLYEFVSNRVSLLKYKTSKVMKVTSTAENIYKIIIHTIKPYINYIHLLESEKFILTQIIAYCIFIIQKTRIPVLIVCHENNLSNNYARFFNSLSSSRKYFSFDYSKKWQEKGIKQFTEHLNSIISLLNRGKGIILLVDYYPLTIIDSKLVLNLKIPIFSFSNVSLPLLYTINESEENEAINIATNIIRNQNNRKDNVSLTSKSERINNIYLQNMKDLFPYLDTTKTNEILYNSLFILSDKLKIKITDKIIIDYIYHGNCILSNINFQNRKYPHPDILDHEILEMIQNSLRLQPQLSEIHFNEEELNILYNSLYINISIE